MLSLRANLKKMQVKKEISKVVVLFCCMLGGLSSTFAQKIAPVEGELSLSGSFAEIRSAHFHGGVDFRTGGVIGKPIFAIDDGYVSRVSVSPIGYGNALYLNHPDGTTSVYAHLDSFDPCISELVRKEQYKQNSFKIDFSPADTIYFKKGEVIALSGNSGSSGGPHLHFEIRDTESNLDINAAHYIKVKDNIAPEIKGIYLYQVDMYGHEERMGKYSVVKSGNRYSSKDLKVRAGLFGIGLHVVDRMEGSTGKLGLYSMKVYADEQLISSYVADTISFDQNRHVNVVGDYEAYLRNETVYRTFGTQWNSVYGCASEFDGYLGVEQDSLVNVCVEISDYNGNISHLAFRVRGGESRQSSYDGVLWHSDEENYARVGCCKLSLDEASLIRNVVVNPKVIQDTVRDVEIYSFLDKEEPLLKPAKVILMGEFDSKSVVCRVNWKKRLRPIASERCDEGLSVAPTTLGAYCVVVDTVKPKIVYRGANTKRLNFSVADALSGVDTIEVLVNGVWTLYEYDAKYSALRIYRDEPTFMEGEDKIEIKVVDVVGNVATCSVNI